MRQGVSVIIPSYNGIDLLRENLPFVMESLEELDRWEIIVIDDQSSDHTKELIESTFSQVRVISNSHNLGFARSVNLGINAARYGLLFLLNNDMRPGRNYITSLLKYFEDPDTFGVMGIIKSSVGDEILEGIKYPILSPSGMTYKDIRDPSIEHVSDTTYSMYVCGGAAIVDRDKVLQLKGFLDVYEPFYMEDVDLSFRAWLSGWKLYFNGQAVCYHSHSATITRYYDPGFIRNISKRNRLIFNYIYLSGYRRRLFLLITRVKKLYYLIMYFFSNQSAYPAFRDFLGMLSTNKERFNKNFGIDSTGSDLFRLIDSIQGNIRRNLRAMEGQGS